MTSGTQGHFSEVKILIVGMSNIACEILRLFAQIEMPPESYITLCDFDHVQMKNIMTPSLTYYL